MIKLNSQQRKFLKTIESKEAKIKLKKLFKKENQKKLLQKSKKLLTSILKKL